MILLDVNVLVDAFRPDQQRHTGVGEWLEGLLAGHAAYGIPELVLSGFVRVVTHPRVFHEPDDLESALVFAERVAGTPNAIVVNPGDRHWEIFVELCRATHAAGNTVPDAYLAALAVEHGGEWITGDRGFARFPQLRWRDPIEDRADG